MRFFERFSTNVARVGAYLFSHLCKRVALGGSLSEARNPFSFHTVFYFGGTVVAVHFQTDIFASLAHFFSDTSVHFDKLSEKS